MKNTIFNCQSSAIKLIARFSLGFSHLHEHKFSHNFQDALIWFAAAVRTSTTTTNLLHFPHYMNERITLLNSFENARNSHRRCSVKKGVLKNFANFTGKCLRLSLFLIKLQALRLATLLKRDSNTGVFLWNLQNV